MLLSAHTHLTEAYFHNCFGVIRFLGHSCFKHSSLKIQWPSLLCRGASEIWEWGLEFPSPVCVSTPVDLIHNPFSRKNQFFPKTPWKCPWLKPSIFLWFLLSFFPSMLQLPCLSFCKFIYPILANTSGTQWYLVNLMKMHPGKFSSQNQKIKINYILHNDAK